MLAYTRVAQAQSDEIQVYDGAIAAPGTLQVTLHNNYTPSGRLQADFPGGLIPEHTLNGVAEWAYGLTPWFEAGFYLPLYSRTGDGRMTFNGFKLRALFTQPDASQRRFAVGLNIELSNNNALWNQARYSLEIRPILAWHVGALDLIVNPILDSDYDGWSRVAFAPSTRLAFHASKTWTFAAEEYADLGPLHHLLGRRAQQQQLYAVIDYSGAHWSLEAGLGAGLTQATDHRVLKLILSRDLK